MITDFKIFENKKQYHDLVDLMVLLSQKMIESYYYNNCGVTIEDAAQSVNLWNFVDNDKVKTGLIADLVSEKDINDHDFKQHNYAEYVKKNTKYFKNELVEFSDIYEVYAYDSDDFDELIAQMRTRDLVEIIEDNGKSKEFKKEFYEEKYEDDDAEYIIIDLYKDEDLYDKLFHYIDDNKVIDYYIEKVVDFSDKFEFVEDCIYGDNKLQQDLFDMDKNTVSVLFDEISHESKLGKSYKFQKAYIDFKIDEDVLGDDDHEEISKLILDIDEKFELHTNLKKIYSVYLDQKKYNM